MHCIKNGILLKLSKKRQIKKEVGKVIFCTDVNLSWTNDGRDLTPSNTEHFDKTFLLYKKHLMFLTEKGIVLYGYSPITKSKNIGIEKTYQKVYAIDNINAMYIMYRTDEVNYTAYKTETTQRTVRNEYGRTYREEVTEQKPYETTGTVDSFVCILIDFKNLVIDTAFLGLKNKKKEVKIANKIIKVCNKINIPCSIKGE